MDVTPQPTPHADPPAPAGELIVHNGRLSGTRKTLNAALTLLGRAEGCDVRLNAEGVLPIHCAVIRGPAGLGVRALHGAVTLVNGRPIAEGPLHDGDLLGVGPFQFRVALAPAAEPIDRAALEREKDALRIQAAAVVAQQAALTEQEVRLQQRRVALERQEAQLSAHLEERRQKVVELQGQVREARMALRDERVEHEKRVAETTAELLRTRRDLKAGQDKLRDDRRRLAHLHKRLRRRHAAQGKAVQAAARAREDRLAGDRRKLEAEQAALNEARLRFNGEAELGRRQLQDGWDELRRAQKHWEERRGRDDADLRRRAREAAESEQALAEQWQRWEETRRGLEAEAEGLESRVRNLRRKMQEQEQEAQRHGAAPAPSPATPPEAVAPPPRPRPEPSAGERERLAGLEVLAGELADQRLHLLEQAARLARAQEEWRAEQAAALAELDEAGRRLQEREARIEPSGRALAEAEADLRRRAEAVAQRQGHLDGWQARLTAQAAAWEAKRESLLAAMRGREEVARRQADVMDGLRRRWAQRRQKELESLRGELQRCGAARRQYAALWEECLNRGAALEQQQRALAERALALEQYRLEVIGRAADSAAAEKRLERLRRRCAAPTAAARRNLDRERQALSTEAKRLQEVAQQLDKQGLGLAEREAALSERLTSRDQGQADADTAGTRLRAEVRALTAQRDRHEREAQALRDEVERLARLLMEDGPTLLPVGQVAA
jgi:chromosome segregation ATPase